MFDHFLCSIYNTKLTPNKFSRRYSPWISTLWRQNSEGRTLKKKEQKKEELAVFNPGDP